MFCLLLQKFGTIVLTRQKVKEIRDYLGDPPVNLPRPKNSPRAVFAPRDADAGPGLFDSHTPLLLTMYNKKKKAQPLAKLSFLVTRTGIEPMLQP